MMATCGAAEFAFNCTHRVGIDLFPSVPRPQICRNIYQVLATLRSAFPQTSLLLIELASCTSGCSCAFRMGGKESGKPSGVGSRRRSKDRCNVCKVAHTASGVNQELRQELGRIATGAYPTAAIGRVRLVSQPGVTLKPLHIPRQSTPTIHPSALLPSRPPTQYCTHPPSPPQPPTCEHTCHACTSTQRTQKDFCSVTLSMGSLACRLYSI